MVGCCWGFVMFWVFIVWFGVVMLVNYLVGVCGWVFLLGFNVRKMCLKVNMFGVVIWFDMLKRFLFI